MAVVVVRPSDTRRLAAAQVILNRHLGEHLYSHQKLEAIAADDEALLAAWDEASVLGAAVARLLHADDAGYYADFGAAATDLFSQYRIGSLEALAVEESMRHRGIGRWLTLEQMSWMARRGCDVAVAISWRSGGKGTSARMYRDLGFTTTAPVPDFYLAESAGAGWTCPVCLGPCRCAAAFCWRQLR